MTTLLQPEPISARRVISVCVDDFGQHEGINRAALELADRRRVSAVSCLVDGPAWPTGARALRERTNGVEMGLHLNFTEDFGQGGCHALAGLIARAYGRQLDRVRIRMAVGRQFDRFEQAMGRLPDFVDGHQHVHQLPVIRDQLIAVMDQRYGSARPWLRSTLPAEGCPPSTAFKAWLIGRLGAKSLHALARRRGYPQNSHLVGVYGFGLSETDYLLRMKAWLACAGDGDVLMCHPSLPWPGQDPLQDARNREYRALSGESFSALLESARLEVGPLQGRWAPVVKEAGGRRESGV
ncbi:ChbG/HpnK family deacetylase [Thiobacillus thioparus]|uniref:ChbG/HpnK family deacetylase n=1 Tax=Thiobacillus thioparus TaxID=931 RepID=UPI00039B5B4D|nr:ChbG/HpnK family deacetylase [Thiobacillus thioparus]